MNSNFKKAQFIAENLGEDFEDVYDILLGNITQPQELCYSVETASREYDAITSKMVTK